MSKLSAHTAPSRSSGDEHVFTDTDGRLWCAALEERDDPCGALVFRCISDGRRSVRALQVDPLALHDAVDDAWRGWLDDAPRIGILS